MDYLARMLNGIQIVQNDATLTADFSLGPLANLAITAPYTLKLADVGKLVTNKGGLGVVGGRTVTLPPTSLATISSVFYSLWYEFVDYSGLGIQVQANTGQYISIGDDLNLSSLAGSMTNRRQYNKIKLTLLDTGVWIAEPNSNWLTA